MKWTNRIVQKSCTFSTRIVYTLRTKFNCFAIFTRSIKNIIDVVSMRIKLVKNQGDRYNENFATPFFKSSSISVRLNLVNRYFCYVSRAAVIEVTRRNKRFGKYTNKKYTFLTFYNLSNNNLKHFKLAWRWDNFFAIFTNLAVEIPSILCCSDAQSFLSRTHILNVIVILFFIISIIFEFFFTFLYELDEFFYTQKSLVGRV